MKEKVLIITLTQEDNNCVDTVSNALKKLGAEVIHFYVDKYPLEQYLSSTYNNGRWELLLSNGKTQHCLNDFAGVWNRRFRNLGFCLKNELDSTYIGHSINESKRTFFGLLRHLEQDVFFINSFSALEIAECKELQLRIASELGIHVPKTCITNNPQVAKKFLEDCPNGAISKMQHNFRVIQDGEEATLFTNTVSVDDIDRLDSLPYCPMQFQEKVEKKLELRIIIVGNKCYSFSIDSQAHDAGKTDWRKIGAQTINDWKPHSIPQELEQQLVRYLQYFSLNYGAADFVLTPNDEYVFLEINPAGEFFWIDEMLDFEISEQLAKLLLNQAPRNKSRVQTFQLSKTEAL